MSIPLRSVKIPDEYYLKSRIKFGYKILDVPTFFNTLDIKCVPNVGALVYKQGATYPFKGVPDPEQIYAINIVKELLKQILKNPLMLFRLGETCNLFNRVFDRVMDTWKVSPLYACPTTRGVFLIVSSFLKEVGVRYELAEETGYNLSHIVEYDDAYRYFIQDIATECDVDSLRNNPRKEIKRLLNLFIERDLKLVGVLKIKPIIKALLWVLWIPKYRRAFLKTVVYIKAMKFDEADFYWASLKDGYNFGGLTFTERTKNIQIPPVFYMKETVDKPFVQKLVDVTMEQYEIHR